jgi:hypothetical protein
MFQFITMKRLVIASLIFSVYMFFVRSGCGTSGSIACPPAELEEGLGTTLDIKEVCPHAGYLCYQRKSFKVDRWPLTQGRLFVRFAVPHGVSPEVAKELLDAAIEGVMVWDNRPFPIVTSVSKFYITPADIQVVWTNHPTQVQGGHVNFTTMPDRNKRQKFVVDEMSISFQKGPDAVRIIAMHEMGHALGLPHSDRQTDIMFPQMPKDPTKIWITERDIQTLEALYALPNGARVE